MTTTEEEACSSMSPCAICKVSSRDATRDLCTRCLNRSLQRACYRSGVLSASPSKVSLGSPRALFPGMPRAIIGPVNQKKSPPPSGLKLQPMSTTENCVLHLEARPRGVMIEARTLTSSTTENGSSATVQVDVFGVDGKVEVKGVCLQDVSSTPIEEENCPKESQSECDPDCRTDPTKEVNIQVCLLKPDDCNVEVFSSELKGVDKEVSINEKCVEKKEVSAEKSADRWHLFEIRKNLTVKLPKSPSEVAKRKCRNPLAAAPSKKPGYVSLPGNRENSLKNTIRPSRVKQWPTKSDASAEADLMMRLLADSIPILKSRAPIVLPPCEVRPASSSPPDSPGDPLWKRRCIPCPRSLKLQLSLVSAR